MEQSCKFWMPDKSRSQRETRLFSQIHRNYSARTLLSMYLRRCKRKEQVVGQRATTVRIRRDKRAGERWTKWERKTDDSVVRNPVNPRLLRECKRSCLADVYYTGCFIFTPPNGMSIFLRLKNKKNEEALYRRRSHKCLTTESYNRNTKVIKDCILDRSATFTKVLVQRVVRSSKYKIDIVVTWNQIRNR